MQTKLIIELLCVVTGELLTARNQCFLPSPCCCAQNIRMKCVVAHNDPLWRYPRERVLDHLEDFGIVCFKKPNIAYALIQKLVPNKTRLKRKPVIARRKQIRVGHTDRSVPVCERLFRQVLPEVLSDE